MIIWERLNYFDLFNVYFSRAEEMTGMIGLQ